MSANGRTSAIGDNNCALLDEWLRWCACASNPMQLWRLVKVPRALQRKPPEPIGWPPPPQQRVQVAAAVVWSQSGRC